MVFQFGYKWTPLYNHVAIHSQCPHGAINCRQGRTLLCQSAQLPQVGAVISSGNRTLLNM